MLQQHGFVASYWQYKYQLKKWGLLKSQKSKKSPPHDSTTKLDLVGPESIGFGIADNDFGFVNDFDVEHLPGMLEHKSLGYITSAPSEDQNASTVYGLQHRTDVPAMWQSIEPQSSSLHPQQTWTGQSCSDSTGARFDTADETVLKSLLILFVSSTCKLLGLH